jgi:type IV secretion system protein VirB1
MMMRIGLSTVSPETTVCYPYSAKRPDTLQNMGMTPIELLNFCAPDIAPVTLAAIVQQESGGNPFLLHDNTTNTSLRPGSAAKAANLARALIDQRHSVDIGLAQINNRNLSALGLRIEDVLDPCTNLRAAQSVLKMAWEQSGHDLRGTLAAYNTGKPGSAVGARYSEQVFVHAGIELPAIPGGKMAKWVNHKSSWVPSILPPIRPTMTTWTPAASPLKPPNNAELAPHGF